jgi:hypothetical protein
VEGDPVYDRVAKGATISEKNNRRSKPMRNYISIIIAMICAWLAPNAMADRLVSQEPKVVHRRIITEREFLRDYYEDDEGRTYRTTRVRDWDDDDDDEGDDDDRYDGDDDDDDRVVIRRPHRTVRRVIIRD